MLASLSPRILPPGEWVAESSFLRVLSYNLLAPIYVRPIDKRTGKVSLHYSHRTGQANINMAQVQEFAAFAWAEPAAEVFKK